MANERKPISQLNDSFKFQNSEIRNEENNRGGERMATKIEWILVWLFEYKRKQLQQNICLFPQMR